jgi:hypothetical protein
MHHPLIVQLTQPALDHTAIAEHDIHEFPVAPWLAIGQGQQQAGQHPWF